MGWIVLGMAAAATISAASSIAVNEMNRGKGKIPGATSVGEKKPFELPDMFKSKSGPLMGGRSNQAPGLSQKLEEPTATPQPTPPQFGPSGGGAFDDLERKRQLAAMFGGIS